VGRSYKITIQAKMTDIRSRQNGWPNSSIKKVGVVFSCFHLTKRTILLMTWFTYKKY